MRWKAVFFDRDGTLTYNDPAQELWRNETISAWSGKTFVLDYDKMMALFHQAAKGRSPWYRNVEDEKGFFLRYYRLLLEGEGVRENLDARAECLFQELWTGQRKLVYPEVRGVLDYFKRRGYRMGVISDSAPSLELTLKNAGLAEYFTSFTASSLVGAGKPNPIIYKAALAAQEVHAEESLYVDDYDVEADGARNLGFTAFHLDRKGGKKGEWTIETLEAMVEYVEKTK